LTVTEGNANVGVAVTVGEAATVGVEVGVGVEVFVGVNVSVAVGVSVTASVVAMLTRAVAVACSSVAGAQAEANSMTRKINRNTFISILLTKADRNARYAIGDPLRTHY